MTIEELKKTNDGLKRMMVAMATYKCDGKRVIEILTPAISFIGEEISRQQSRIEHCEMCKDMDGTYWNFCGRCGRSLSSNK